MYKKILVWLLATLFLNTTSLAGAQQPKKIPRIGYISGTGDSTNQDANSNALRHGLRELGYIEGKNIHLESRSMEGTVESIPTRVAELVQLNVDVLLVGPLLAIRAAKQATKTIPIVMVTSVDPVATGLIDSLARPGGNITGLATLSRELGGKRLELLKEVAPTIARVGVLADADAPVSAIAFKEYEPAASALKLQLQPLDVRGPNPDLEGAFQVATKGRVSAIIAVNNPLLSQFRKRIAELAIKNRLPLTPYVDDGGLMSYATNQADQYRRAAVFVDKILKGAKPADLPVEQPMKFEFVVNLKTAKQIGVTIPPNVLVRANRIIR